MINPVKLLKIKKAWDTFTKSHPKFPKFLEAVHQNAMEEGTVIEIKVTSETGQALGTNVKLTKSDVELFRELTELFGNM